MNSLTLHVIIVVIILGLAAVALLRHKRLKTIPLIIYIIAVAVVWAVILAFMWFSGDMARFHEFALVFYGFVIGMVAMFIAVHVYKS
jgi:Kef-type K+ transport system membrane component KefB